MAPVYERSQLQRMMPELARDPQGLAILHLRQYFPADDVERLVCARRPQIPLRGQIGADLLARMQLSWTRQRRLSGLQGFVTRKAKAIAFGLRLAKQRFERAETGAEISRAAWRFIGYTGFGAVWRWMTVTLRSNLPGTGDEWRPPGRRPFLVCTHQPFFSLSVVIQPNGRDMDARLITEWSNYLSVQASAAATLTGLVFVAVSINLSRVLSIPGLTGRAAESILQLFGVVIISTTALIPHQSSLALGIEILTIGCLLWVVQTVLQIRYMKRVSGHPRRWGITRIVQTHLASVPFCISGILLIRDSTAGMYWLAPGCIFSLISGVSSAWVLLVEILR
jgi:hypothetical protein